MSRVYLGRSSNHVLLSSLVWTAYTQHPFNELADGGEGFDDESNGLSLVL